MIPRSDRVFFHVEGSPTIPSKSPPPPSFAKMDATACLPTPVPNTTRWNGGKRNTVVKEPRKPRVMAPATPWRPRISRKTSSPFIEDHQDHPSPLDRKAAGSTLNLELGAKLEPATVSPAPTSATLVAGADKRVEQPARVGDAYRHEAPQPATPRLEQGEQWRTDRWKLLRSELKGTTEQPHARVDAFRQHQTAFSPPHRPLGSGVDGAAYQASARRAQHCWALDMSNETNVYVTGLPKEMDDHMLYLLGSACGVVISHKSMLDRQTGRCKGFGFLMYASSEMAKQAIEWLNCHGFIASFAKESFTARLRRMADTSSTNVYLSNLPVKFTVQQLEQLFAPYPIASLKILYDVHGESRGVGFVRLYDRATAKECIDRLHGRMLPGKTLPLQVRFADSEAQKQLKHSVSQKHTLESLGLVSRQAEQQDFVEAAKVRAGHSMQQDLGLQYHRAGIERARSASELDAALVRAQAVSTSRAGLGIQLPAHTLWAQTHLGPVPAAEMMAPQTMAGVMYSGMEGSYAFDRPYPMSPLVPGEWEQSKGYDGLAVPFIPPPPGLVHPAHDPRCTDDASALRLPEAVGKDSASARPTGSRPTRTRTKQAPVRVRVPANSTDSTQRAVSDPMAMLTAQSRIREALGMRERVRAAVSADNSFDDAHDTAATGDTSMLTATSTSSNDGSCVEDDSYSVEIQINTVEIGK